MMQLISEKLLKQKIRELESRQFLDEHELFLKSLCEKELKLIQKLEIDFDMTGTVEDVEKRLNDQSLYMMHQSKYDSMVEKEKKYDAIENIVNGEKTKGRKFY